MILRLCRVIYFRITTDLCVLRASSLTFYSTLSVVPILAVIFGIAKGFGIESLLEQSLKGEFKEQEEMIQYLINFGYTLLDQTKGGLIAGIGVVTLLYTVLNLFSTIEASLNEMWGLRYGRSIPRKISDYLALILICPIFLVTASSITLFITTQVESIELYPVWLEQLQPLMKKMLLLLPYIMSCTLFTFMYLFMPNTKVRFTSALVAGCVAGAAYQGLQASYISVQIVVSKTGAIYGSFAALPLFLFWMYLSWMIFLIGAEIVVIHQERLWDPIMLAPYRTLSQLEKDVISLSITKIAVDAFLSGKEPVEPASIAQLLKMPFRLITELIEQLVQAHVIVKTESSSNTVTGISLAKNPDELRLYDVIHAIHNGGDEIHTHVDHPLFTTFVGLLQEGREKPNFKMQNPLIKDVQCVE